MTNLANTLIDHEILMAAKAKGLSVEVTHTQNKTNPRKLTDKASTSVFVAGRTGRASGISDVNIPNALQGRRISDTIENYAGWQGIEVTDLLCWTVYKYEDGGDITLSTTLFQDMWGGDIAGFIYENKTTLREEFGVKRISPRLKVDLGERIQTELNELCAWANDRCYTVALIDDDGDVVNSISQYYDRLETLNVVAGELVDECDLEIA